MRGGGFVVKAVTATPATPAKAQLEIDVPPRPPPGSYPITVTGTDGTEAPSTRRRHARRRPEVDSGIQITADFPSLKGEPASGFTLQPDGHQQHARAADVHVRPDGSEGVDRDGVAERPRPTPRRHDRCRWQQHRQGRRHPADRHGQGKYPIDVASRRPTGRRGKIELTAEVTGSPKLALQTADQKLNTSGTANTEKRVPMIVSNTGTAALSRTSARRHRADRLGRVVRPQDAASVQPNETAQVTADHQAGQGRGGRRLHADRPLQRRQRVVERRPALHGAGVADARASSPSPSSSSPSSPSPACSSASVGDDDRGRRRHRRSESSSRPEADQALRREDGGRRPRPGDHAAARCSGCSARTGPARRRRS